MANRRDLSFATFNLFNLASPGTVTYGPGPAHREDMAGLESYARKIDWTADMLRRLDADAIGFQEVWSAEALRECFAVAELARSYDILARDAPGPGRPQVALAVRKGHDGRSRLHRRGVDRGLPRRLRPERAARGPGRRGGGRGHALGLLAPRAHRPHPPGRRAPRAARGRPLRRASQVQGPRAPQRRLRRRAPRMARHREPGGEPHPPRHGGRRPARAARRRHARRAHAHRGARAISTTTASRSPPR